MQITITKPVQQAIDEKLSLYWAGAHDSWRVTLRAVTSWNENGTARSRYLWSSYEPEALRAMNDAIRQAGGVIDESLAPILAKRQEEWASA